MEELECIEVNSSKNPEGCVIWLHGLGADSDDFLPMVDQLNIPNKKNIKFIFPSALFRSISINNGVSMRAWFDIIDLAINKREDAFGIKQSNELITNLINKQINNNIPANKIIIGGFSQGAAMALHAGLRFHSNLAGIIAFSGYCPRISFLAAEQNPNNKNTPIFQTHGLFDPIVPLHIGKSSFEYLLKMQYKIKFKTYPIQHTVSVDEINDLSLELSKMLKVESVK